MKAHILIIEDDPAIINLLVFILSDSGYRTTVATDPDAVAPLLAQERIDLVLLDATRLHTDGLSLRTGIKRTHPTLPVLFHPVRARRAATAPADRAPPFEPLALLARIRAALPLS